MVAILVVDMQVGLLEGAPKHDLSGVVERINLLTASVRERAGRVVWVRHCGASRDAFEPRARGWAFLPELTRCADDLVVEKHLNDPFAGTALKGVLGSFAPDRMLIVGWATDFCVDATVRSAVSNDFDVVVIGDAHTLSDRPHLAAPDVNRHHNGVWSELLTRRAVRVVTTRAFLDETTPSGDHGGPA